MELLQGNLREAASISIETQRVRLLFRGSKEKGWYFHSLVLEYMHDNEWKSSLAITQEQFEGTHTHRRWVSGLHSFDPASGIVILKIGEFDEPKGFRSSHVSYSWRSWDLKNNRQVSMLKKCTFPLEPYVGSRNAATKN
jgi:hypothetical protein